MTANKIKAREMTATKMTATKKVKATKMTTKNIKFKQQLFYAPQKKIKAKTQRFKATSMDELFVFDRHLKIIFFRYPQQI